MQVLLGLGDGLGELLDEDELVLLGDELDEFDELDEDGADDVVVNGSEVEDEPPDFAAVPDDPPLTPALVPPDGCPVSVGVDVLASLSPMAVGGPGFAGVPVCFTGGSVPVSRPIGIPLIGTPRRYASASASTSAT